jgi:hypothetical protein
MAVDEAYVGVPWATWSWSGFLRGLRSWWSVGESSETFIAGSVELLTHPRLPDGDVILLQTTLWKKVGPGIRTVDRAVIGHGDTWFHLPEVTWAVPGSHYQELAKRCQIRRLVRAATDEDLVRLGFTGGTLDQPIERDPPAVATVERVD